MATVAALVPAGFFYSQYAMTDAVFPVVTLAWLLVTHSWLVDEPLSQPGHLPGGTRSLSGQLRTSLGSVHGTIHVLEMAAGQLWRLILDRWGLAGIGLVGALGVIVRGGWGHRGRGCPQGMEWPPGQTPCIEWVAWRAP